MTDSAQKDVLTRAIEWAGSGERGISSDCIWRTMMGLSEPNDWTRAGRYPLDPADFSRCRLLLKAVPEWRERMPEMSIHGPVWAAMSARWEEIERSFVEEVGDVPKHGAHAKRTYDLMRQIEDGARPAQRGMVYELDPKFGETK